MKSRYSAYRLSGKSLVELHEKVMLLLADFPQSTLVSFSTHFDGERHCAIAILDVRRDDMGISREDREKRVPFKESLRRMKEGPLRRERKAKEGFPAEEREIMKREFKEEPTFEEPFRDHKTSRWREPKLKSKEMEKFNHSKDVDRHRFEENDYKKKSFSHRKEENYPYKRKDNFNESRWSSTSSYPGYKRKNEE